MFDFHKIEIAVINWINSKIGKQILEQKTDL